MGELTKEIRGALNFPSNNKNSYDYNIGQQPGTSNSFSHERKGTIKVLSSESKKRTSDISAEELNLNSEDSSTNLPAKKGKTGTANKNKIVRPWFRKDIG